jgi:excinuclease UvrABC helicase subunit UvrB
MYDIVMMRELGYCTGIEKHSRNKRAGRRDPRRMTCSTIFE